MKCGTRPPVPMLNQPCQLCLESPVRYVKTKARFFKVCANCEQTLKAGGILVEPRRILLMKSDSAQ